MELLDTAPSDDEDEAVGAGSFSASAKIKDGLPGAGAKGKPAVRTKCVRLSPTGRCARCLIPSIPAGKAGNWTVGVWDGATMALERGTTPEMSRRACACENGLQSRVGGDWPREVISHRIPNQSRLIRNFCVAVFHPSARGFGQWSQG